MKKITIILVLVLASFSLFADGDDVKNYNSLRYNPQPSTGEVGQAFNIYLGAGSVRRAGFGFNIGFDYEIPVIDPNLTLGPGIKMGFSPYTYTYWDKNTGWETITGLGMLFYGGVTAHYYFDWLIPNMPDEFDVFITSNAGGGLVTYTNNDYYKDYYDNDVFLDFGFAVGGRWNFADNMSMYLQVGEGTSNVLFGLSFKM